MGHSQPNSPNIKFYFLIATNKKRVLGSANIMGEFDHLSHDFTNVDFHENSRLHFHFPMAREHASWELSHIKKASGPSIVTDSQHHIDR